MTDDMNDRELLELAAKAGGVVVFGFFDDGSIKSRVHSQAKWNPLTDDGDALRLANRLRMRIGHHIVHPFVAVFYVIGDRVLKSEESHGCDVNAATRRAIVRAAAEIGRLM